MLADSPATGASPLCPSPSRCAAPEAPIAAVASPAAFAPDPVCTWGQTYCDRHACDLLVQLQEKEREELLVMD